MLVRKPFDAALYRASDSLARMAAKKYLTSLGYLVRNNPDRFGVDLFAEKDGSVIPVEVEVKLVWKGAKFPWKSIQIAGRKEKFAKLDGSKFMMFNSNLTNAVIILGSDVIASPRVEIDTRYTTGEWFFQIPIGKAQIVPV